jgi:hypothetical protein
VFWDLTPCKRVELHSLFIGVFYLHFQINQGRVLSWCRTGWDAIYFCRSSTTFLQNVGSYKSHTVSSQKTAFFTVTPWKPEILHNFVEACRRFGWKYWRHITGYKNCNLKKKKVPPIHSLLWVWRQQIPLKHQLISLRPNGFISWNYIRCIHGRDRFLWNQMRHVDRYPLAADVRTRNTSLPCCTEATFVTTLPAKQSPVWSSVAPHSARHTDQVSLRSVVFLYLTALISFPIGCTPATRHSLFVTLPSWQSQDCKLRTRGCSWCVLLPAQNWTFCLKTQFSPSVQPPPIYLSICPTIYPSIDLSIQPFSYLSILPPVSLYLSIYLASCLSVCPTIYPSICLHPTTLLSIYSPTHPSNNLSIYLSIHPSIYPLIYQSIYLLVPIKRPNLLKARGVQVWNLWHSGGR